MQPNRKEAPGLHQPTVYSFTTQQWHQLFFSHWSVYIKPAKLQMCIWTNEHKVVPTDRLPGHPFTLKSVNSTDNESCNAGALHLSPQLTLHAATFSTLTFSLCHQCTKCKQEVQGRTLIILLAGLWFIIQPFFHSQSLAPLHWYLWHPNPVYLISTSQSYTLIIRLIREQWCNH